MTEDFVRMPLVSMANLMRAAQYHRECPFLFWDGPLFVPKHVHKYLKKQGWDMKQFVKIRWYHRLKRSH